jgi:PhnB protein
MIEPVPRNYPCLCPYLVVDGAVDAIGFYAEVLAATERMRLPGPSGKVVHAELAIGDSVLMLADPFPEMGARDPRAVGGSPVTLRVYVDEVDAVFTRAVARGATPLQEPSDRFYGDREAEFEDPWGHRWSIATHVEDVSPDEMARRAAALGP